MRLSFWSNLNLHLPSGCLFGEVYLVEVETLALEKLKLTALAVFAEAYIHSRRIIEAITHEQFCFFIVTVITGHPHQGKDSLLELLPNWHSANGICIGPRQCFNLVYLQFPILIVEGFGCAGIGHGGDVLVVLELPVGPAAEVEFHEIGEDGDLLCTFDCARQGAVLGHEPADFHIADVLLFGGHLEGVEDLAEVGRDWFSQGSHVGTVDVVAEHLFIQFIGSSGSLEESTSKDIDDTGLEEDIVLLVIFADGLVEPFIGRQQVFIVALPWQQTVRWVSVQVGTYGLVDELVTDKIGFVSHVSRKDLPYFAQMIQQSPLIGKQVSLQFHEVVGQVELGEWYFEAIFPEGEALVIIPEFDFKRGGERLPLGCPDRQSFSAELFEKQVLMSVEQDHDAEFIAFPDYVSENFNIGVVVYSLLGFDPFPSCVKPDDVHAPVSQVEQIVIGQTGVGAVLYKIGVEGEDLIDCVDSVVDSISVVLVDEHRVVGVHSHTNSDSGQ